MLEMLTALPLVLPPSVLGYYLLVWLSPQSIIGSWYERVFSVRLAFSFPAIVIASVIFNLPFMLAPICNAMRAVEQRYIESAWCLGLSRWQTWLHVKLPMSRGGLMTGVLLTFAHCVGEFGVVLMVGGNIAGRTRTIALSLYDDVLTFNFEQANRTASALLAFSVITLLLLHQIRSRRPIL